MRPHPCRCLLCCSAVVLCVTLVWSSVCRMLLSQLYFMIRCALYHALHLVFLLCGGVFFWRWIRSQQTDFEAVIYSRILQECRYYQRYKDNRKIHDPSLVIAELLDALFSTSEVRWKEIIQKKPQLDLSFVGFDGRDCTRNKDIYADFPAEISMKLAELIDTLISENITSWYTPISIDPEFLSQIKCLLTQLSTQLIAKCLAMNSFQALQLTSNILNIVRLHLKWFREAFVSQSQLFPDSFQSTISQGDTPQSIHRRQLLASYAKQAAFQHPACSNLSSNSTIPENCDSETIYLRHFVMQILQNFFPEISSHSESGLCISAAIALLREVLVTQCLKPLLEYLTPPHMTELVCATLKPFATQFPNIESGETIFPSRKIDSNSLEFHPQNGNAEAVFSLIANFAASTGNNFEPLSSSEKLCDAEDEEMAMWSPKSEEMDPMTAPLEKKSSITSIFKSNSIGSKLISVNFPISPPNSATQFEDLRNKTADIQSSLNSSLTKVKKRFQTFSNSGVIDGAFHKSLPLASSQATKMMKRPGILLQKALKRSEIVDQIDENAQRPWTASQSPENFFEEALIVEDHDRLLISLEKTVDAFVHQKAEMLPSARSREFYELLISLEQVFKLGFRDEKKTISQEIASYWDFLAIDREESVELNALWRHVALDCPSCISSRFLTPRGIQWILLAIEKKALCDHLAILASDKHHLEQFYHLDRALLSHGTAFPRILEILQILENFDFRFEISSLLGRSSDFDAEFMTQIGTGIHVVDTAWQVERYDLASGWQLVENALHDDLPSSEWMWISPWNVTQVEEYEYANALDESYHMKEEEMDQFRRRKWTRKRYQFPFVIELLTISEAIVMEQTQKSRKMTRIFNRPASVDRSMTISEKISGWSKNLEISVPSSLKLSLRKERMRAESVDVLFVSPTSNTTETEDEIFCGNCNCKTISGNCGNCYHPMCENCLNFYAFLTYPPDGSSTQVQVCGSCHAILTQKYKLEIDVRVSRYFSGLPGFTFEIILSAKSQMDRVWSVIRCFDDFMEMEKRMYELLHLQERQFAVEAQCQSHWEGVDYHEVRNLGRLSEMREELCEYEDVMKILQGYLIDLIGSFTLCQSPIVYQFLNLELLHHGDDGLAIIQLEEQMMANKKVECSEKEVEMDQSQEETIDQSQDSHEVEIDQSQEVEIDQSQEVEINQSQEVGMDQSQVPKVVGQKTRDSTKWFSTKWNPWEVNSQTKESKVKLLQDIEESLVGVLNEMFEFDGIGMVRRQIFALTRSFIRAFLTTSHIRNFEKQFAAMMGPDNVVMLLDELHAVLKQRIASEYVDNERKLPSLSESYQARQECLKLILASLPTSFVSLFGESSCGASAVKLCEFLQHETYVKNLAFSIWDEILLQVFPEYKPLQTA